MKGKWDSRRKRGTQDNIFFSSAIAHIHLRLRNKATYAILIDFRRIRLRKPQHIVGKNYINRVRRSESLILCSHYILKQTSKLN